MKNWITPLLVFAAGSAGAVLTSDRGRKFLREAVDTMLDTHDQLLTWNESAQAELERIQQLLAQLSHSLAPQTGQHPAN